MIAPTTRSTTPTPTPMFPTSHICRRLRAVDLRLLPLWHTRGTGLSICHSEGFFGQIHQRQVGRLGDRTFGGQLRKHVAGEELRRGDLALVERLVLRADLAAELLECYLGLPQQQPRTDDVSE